MRHRRCLSVPSNPGRTVTFPTPGRLRPDDCQNTVEMVLPPWRMTGKVRYLEKPAITGSISGFGRTLGRVLPMLLPKGIIGHRFQPAAKRRLRTALL